MHDDVDFSGIRLVGGTPHAGFEALCCQLAEHAGDPPAGSIFHRKAGGGGDEGVECYYVLPDGSEWGWQAKYFDGRVGQSQWRQIDHSVRRALERHPRLTRYVVCVPRDLSWQRGKDGKNQFDKWQGYVQKWEDVARGESMSVTFEFWGKHEIVDRLRRDALTGATRWWFGLDELSEQWFRHRFDEARANVGPRYSPQLHVDLPIAGVFDAVGRTPAFFRSARETCGTLRQAWQELTRAVATAQELKNRGAPRGSGPRAVRQAHPWTGPDRSVRPASRRRSFLPARHRRTGTTRDRIGGRRGGALP